MRQPMRPANKWLALSLRTFLLLILASGLWFGWQVNRARGQRRGVAQIDRYGGLAVYDFEFANGQHLPGEKPWAPEWVRRGLGDEYFQEVAAVVYRNQAISDATLAPLEELNRVEEVHFYSDPHSPDEVKPPPGLERLTMSGVARLENLSCLRCLDIQVPLKRGSMLNHLSRPAQLEELHLSWMGITDAEMPHLRSMQRLRVLNLWRNGLTGTCLQEIRGSKSLETLWLSDNPISKAGLKNIGSLTNLRFLDLSNTGIDSDGLSHLRTLTQLRTLRLASTRVTATGLVHLREMRQLETLDLQECSIAGPGFSWLKGLTCLKELLLHGSNIDDAGLTAVEGLAQLETLGLGGTRITDAGLEHLLGLKNLTVLVLSETRVTDERVARLRKELPSLTKVALFRIK